jgi:class 3 adenylate cyclase
MAAIHKHVGDCVVGGFGAPWRCRGAVRAAPAIRNSVAKLSAEVGGTINVHVGVVGGGVVANTTGSAAYANKR